MALIVGADSYISLVDADTYLSNHYIAADPKKVAWDALTDADCEALLRKAAITIDRQPLVGLKATIAQTLAFPRAIYSDFPNYIYQTQAFINDSNWYVQTSVPTEVKEAQCEIAIESTQTTPNRVKLQRQGVKSFSLGSLSESYTGSQNNIISQEAKELLSPYIGGGFRI